MFNNHKDAMVKCGNHNKMANWMQMTKTSQLIQFQETK